MAKRRAIISLFDKSGVLPFAKALQELDFEILSTGGTAKLLSDEGIPVTQVSDVTGFPECLDGRVKTLHPKIHAGILAMRDNPEHMQALSDLGVSPVDIVDINLYPFRETVLRDDVTFQDIIEKIDIGGPTMLRAAAKNWQDVAVICDPADYEIVIKELKEDGEVSKKTKLYLAYKVFETTSAYDTAISSFLRKESGSDIFPKDLTLTYTKVQDMRYGENPFQRAAFYKEEGNGLTGTLAAAEQIHGKELSYNNINDTSGALDTLKEFGNEQPCVVAVKHANPCGVATGADVYEAYMKAYNADPVSIFGGIVATNREVDKKTAEEMAKIFLEIIVAPSFSDEAKEVLTAKKNLRLLVLPDIALPNRAEMLDMKRIPGGMLVQERDVEMYVPEDIKVVTETKPTDEDLANMLFAMKVCKHTKSNAIVLAKDGATVGVGPGQCNRITSLELAIKYGGDKVQGSVMASDAFFPFSDCVEAAAKAGIKAIVQPGGSIRDEESIEACNKYGIAMIFTGKRHFKH